jgi:P-type Ca2+ transporter type 2C
MIILITIALTASLLVIPPFTHFFKFEILSWSQVVICIVTGSISVVWFELVKAFKRKRNQNNIQQQ